MYKAVFIDMDGTLLQSDHSVSAANRHSIHQLIDKGILVVPISARPLHGMLHLTEKIFPSTTPIVSLNGGYIWHQGQIIFEAAVSLQQAAGIHEEVKKYPASIMYYSRMQWFAMEETTLVKKEQRITPVKITIQPFEKTIECCEQQQAGVNKILIAADKNLILDIEQQLNALHGGELNIYKSQPRYLEVMHAQASKTNAIQFLLKKYGIAPYEIMAIGDNYNDKGMIEFAHTGVAMGNAPDEIKAAADYITDTNNNDGVAKALHHFFSAVIV